MTRKKICIIGAGFSGIMTAVHLLRSENPLQLFICGEKEHFARGTAYSPYSKSHLLNVVAAKMSAFEDIQDDFLNYLSHQEEYAGFEKHLIANAFVPRFLFGNYLEKIWLREKENAQNRGHFLEECFHKVSQVNTENQSVILHFESGGTKEFDLCVLANGNQIPRHPRIENTNFFHNDQYFQNPWDGKCAQEVKSSLPVLILGNGLSMIDTVIGLVENKVKNKIISLSPNGFNILPHRHNGLRYEALVSEMHEKMSLRELSGLIFKHIRTVRKLGLSAEPMIDSLRPHTQRLWQNFTEEEKALFMSRFRHLWGVARHRIPLHIHDKIQMMRIEGKLTVISGKVMNLEMQENAVKLTYFDKKKKELRQELFARVINCTGPETDLSQKDNFLYPLFEKGILVQDSLKLGINACVKTFAATDCNGKSISNIRILGGNLKGILWESTAVNELRRQAKRLAEQILSS
jgi:uncharacterized NAD(P)/FAD-binding protein YdhS